jgi:hypothetical protein
MSKWLLVFLLVWSTPAFGAVVEKTVTVNEPTTNEDGTPLDDLKEIRFYSKKADGTEWIPVVVVPATSVNGGGQISQKMTYDAVDGTHEIGTLDSSAVDTSGNESEMASVALPIDVKKPDKPVIVEITSRRLP